MVSDRDARFTGRFWTSLFEGTKLNFFTTNRADRTCEWFLRRIFETFDCGQSTNWVDLLDIATFCYNLKLSFSTGASLFELAIGQQPLTPNELAYDIIVLSGPLPFRLKKDILS